MKRALPRTRLKAAGDGECADNGGEKAATRYHGSGDNYDVRLYGFSKVAMSAEIDGRVFDSTGAIPVEWRRHWCLLEGG